MKSRSISRESTRTTYIQLDTGKCIACWKCLAECRNHVIGRINLPWHKHSRFINSSECTGCLKCVNVCEHGALTKIFTTDTDRNASGIKLKRSFVINLGLLIFGLAMSLSGFVIQFRYHMGHNSGIESDSTVSAIGYYNWTNIHKISIIIISILAIYHFVLHWRWYKTVILKKLLARNKQQLILTIVFILAAVTGYISWIIDLSGGAEIVRKSLIEIHDKITILLFVLLVIHMTSRLKWYITTLYRFKDKQST
jgi:ferredoxin